MTENMNLSNEMDLETIAAKFVMIPKEITSKDKIISGGYLSEQEYELVKKLPRSSEMESGTRWAKIKSGDKERSLYPFYGCLTESEKQVYRDYKKGLSSATGTSAGSNSIKADEHNAKIEQLKQELIALNVPESVIQKLEQLKMVKKNNIIFELFGVDNLVHLGGKVNLAYVMFRDANGNFAQELQPDIVELVKNGFMPKFTLDQVKDKVKKLAEKGILVHNTIVDLK